MKGISPLIATILLIAITVAVGGLVGSWVFSFTRSSTQTVRQQADIEIICNQGRISLSDVCYSNNYILGYITNTGNIPLGDITLTIFYSNASTQRYYLSFANGAVVPETSCCGNLTILVNEKYMFNISANQNYNKVYVSTNCTSIVTDEVEASDISSC
ncbi:MAG: archaellin/type IV pilin N-terminal domain-containing protein [Candidatus Aenigmatarchaeota archaeon]